VTYYTLFVWDLKSRRVPDRRLDTECRCRVHRRWPSARGASVAARSGPTFIRACSLSRGTFARRPQKRIEFT
jgi:hypothetical protein